MPDPQGGVGFELAIARSGSVRRHAEQLADVLPDDCPAEEPGVEVRAVVRWTAAKSWPVHLLLYGPRWALALPMATT